MGLVNKLSYSAGQNYEQADLVNGDTNPLENGQSSPVNNLPRKESQINEQKGPENERTDLVNNQSFNAIQINGQTDPVNYCS